ncbi:MAG: DUF1592 domain-containing protein [Planctomycetaceae bacterium]|nr:DUF1592 domain-containing protein [Planctomycetaceae bacterium]MDG2387741.1 DUF1592 domain-containing protein [Planctomycetaceae bacterium]
MLSCFQQRDVIASDLLPGAVNSVIKSHCRDCHEGALTEGGLNLTTLEFDLDSPFTRDRWIRVYDRVQKGEMPPKETPLSAELRAQFVQELKDVLHKVDLAEIVVNGRGPVRRLNRDEYQQNLRDILRLPSLDIRDMLPADREGHHFNKTTETLDISHVQLIAYLEASEVALRQAIASEIQPPPLTEYRAIGRKLFSTTSTFGERQAMFFARNSRAIGKDDLAATPDDPEIELALFRSAHWPYYGYPQGFVARLTGDYRVRFSARAVLQLPGFEIKPAVKPVPMTFRARKPSGADVSGDVRATGGLIDVQPKQKEYETTIFLRAGETFEYSLLGLPVPLARNVNGGPPTYRYPPFPKSGQPGVAFQWLELKGPLSPEQWPPLSHRVLFDELPIRSNSSGKLHVEIVSGNPAVDAERLFRRFVQQAARQPVPEEAIQKYLALIQLQLKEQIPFAEAMLTGYQAFLCSPHLLYLNEPLAADNHYAIASRMSYFLTNTKPDAELMQLASDHQLRNARVLEQQTNRLLQSSGFDQFVTNFTDYWLNLKDLFRDEPDIRLYPEYRFDSYLVESMERETRTFFAMMIQENLPASVLVKADFVLVNDRLADHYRLPPLSGSAIRKVMIPDESPYGGLLTQAAILKVTANGTTTSPVVRGAWIMERLLGEPPPPPPASVPAVEPDIRGAKTIRQLLAAHTKQESCAGCHARFDPVGMALENFDILGGWRVRYRGLEEGELVTGIDRAGHDFAYNKASAVESDGKLLDGRQFADIHDLKKILAGQPRQLGRNLLSQFTIYATGTPVRFSDRSEIENILDACESDGYRVGDLLRKFVQSHIFLGPAGCDANQRGEK